MSGISVAAAFAPVDQHYLLQAREMQALSFAVHIPLVAFGTRFRPWCCLSSGLGTGGAMSFT